jgi:hypothetical protein
MIISEREWSTCPTCHHRDKLLHEDIYGCDTCKKVIDLNSKKGLEYLEAVKFYQTNSEATRHHFCSWKCLAKWLKKTDCSHFISLPYLSYDTPHGKRLTKEFLRLLK